MHDNFFTPGLQTKQQELIAAPRAGESDFVTFSHQQNCSTGIHLFIVYVEKIHRNLNKPVTASNILCILELISSFYD
jgi:hypothetical protein